MKRKHADVVAIGIVGGILLVGLLTAVQLFLADTPTMNDGGPAPLMRSVGPVLMSLVFASIVGGVYVFVRGKLFETGGNGGAETPAATDGHHDGGSDEATAVSSDAEPTPATDIDEDDAASSESMAEPVAEPDSGAAGARQLLDVLPDDEKRILEPVVGSPGLTQIQVRDRSGFSKSKVSQTITDLEERGLLYRERQGRTYRVYPADDLDERV